MSVYVLYQLTNLIMMIAIVSLLKLLYDRLEIPENRNLFLMTLGLGIDLVAWFSISHMTEIGNALMGLRISLIGRTLFGIGLLIYMGKSYKAKHVNLMFAVWGTSMLALLGHSFKMPVDSAYLSNIYLSNYNGVVLLLGERGPVYYVSGAISVFVGVWCVVLIIKDLVSKKGKLDNSHIANSIFFLSSTVTLGVVLAVYEVNYRSFPNFLPIFKALATGVYAVLSFKYRFLNFDDLARKSLMNDIGAGFVVLSDKYEILYANDIASDIFPSLERGVFDVSTAEHIVDQREIQLEKGGRTYKITADRILTNGHLEGYTFLMVDISDIVHLENQAAFNETARKNLLTNISHELRTPLNAIIGASEMIDSDDATKDSYKEYANVIRVASINLNDLLNDILTASSEYERVQTSDMAPYSICTLIDNIVDMCNERVSRKRVRFNVSVSDSIPVDAVGDDRRIRQVILNVLTNAIRYTDDGSVSLRVSGEYLSDGRFEYQYTIQDTGRNVFKATADFEKAISTGNELGIDYSTGYGISMMVAKRIAHSLDGNLSVYSVKGRGNIYSLTLPSQLLSNTTLADMNFKKKMSFAFLDEADGSINELKNACIEMGVKYEYFHGVAQIRKYTQSSDQFRALVFDFEKFGKRVFASEKAKGYLKVAVLEGTKIPKDYDGDCIFVQKPLSLLTLNKIYLEYERRLENSSTINTDSFIAPLAKILVVDDNTLNLDIAKNMIESFKATVDVCNNGYECIDLLERGKTYDLIFMDYMMEGMDGIETTEKIRAMRGPISRVPILAFTANAVTGASEKYREAGMNGCVFKPASIQAFANALKTHLRDELIVYDAPSQKHEEEKTDDFPVIKGIDRETAVRYTGGNAQMYRDMLSTFAREIDERKETIIKLSDEGNYKDFTTYVHGIKGLTRTLGMLELSDRMAEMEKAGNELNEAYIKDKLTDLLSLYDSYKEVLEPFVIEKKKNDKQPTDDVEKVLLKMRDLLEDFEMDETEALFDEIWPGEYDRERTPLMYGLRESIDGVDYYASKDYVDKLLETYDK